MGTKSTRSRCFRNSATGLLQTNLVDERKGAQEGAAEGLRAGLFAPGPPGNGNRSEAAVVFLVGIENSCRMPICPDFAMMNKPVLISSLIGLHIH